MIPYLAVRIRIRYIRSSQGQLQAGPTPQAVTLRLLHDQTGRFQWNRITPTSVAGISVWFIATAIILVLAVQILQDG